MLFVCATAIVWAQQTPVLRSTSRTITIVDGGERAVNSWSLDPKARPDVYVADRTRGAKEVCFITDLDSMCFHVVPGSSTDLVILLNGTDSCYTRIRSAITPEDLRYVPPAETQPPDTIPFLLTARNNVLLQAILNERDTLLLMFHTGMRGFTIIEAAKTKVHGLAIADTVHAGSWGGTGSVGRSLHHRLRIGHHTWDDLEMDVDELSGEGSDGKVGYDLFADQVLELDFDQRRLILHDRPPADRTGYSAVPLTYRRSGFYITGRVTTPTAVFDQAFMVHTGHSGALLFGTRSNAEHPALATLDSTGVERLKDPFGHELHNKRTRIPALELGGFTCSNVPASLMDTRSRIPASVIGCGLLQRFNWLLDLRNDVLYLRPGAAFGRPW